ncbi:glutamate-5-semialdehyde dehydrogenase [Bacillus sp. FJAT-47783]|uniref:glutamate-5-semialdehyde dehydrogenase n=1 Tax=Bacillus sp. FJAT-47783 TaxID=2922712 RepID=UPI001FAB4354|nr:glutamate-5-semialdehyde dehydrogenase [Bacillus sp. FJAT-47783]
MNELLEKAKKAKMAAQTLVIKSTDEKNEALKAMASELREQCTYILTENEKDLQKGREAGFHESLLDRLLLNEERIHAMADALLDLVAIQDPVHEVVETIERPNGLYIEKVRVPLGVVGMIYEARPNVTVDASALCLKTGNAVLLRGSTSALHSNIAIVQVIHEALKKVNFPTEAVQLLEDTSRETASKMFKLNDYLDVLIPRGGKKLIQTVIENATVPVLETGAGNCHIFIDETAKLDMALEIVLNAKTQRPSVCNAIETVLVQENWAEEHLQTLINRLRDAGIELRVDDQIYEQYPTLKRATEEDWETEYLDYILAIKLVKDVREAIDHINQYGSHHSEAIISETDENTQLFFQLVDSAAVYHNASTRFTDGFEFGFGAEIGISTQKLHARGPMGLPALTSSKYVIKGNGQVRS